MSRGPLFPVEVFPGVRNRLRRSAARPSRLSLPVWEDGPAFREDER